MKFNCKSAQDFSFLNLRYANLTLGILRSALTFELLSILTSIIISIIFLKA